MFLLDLWCGPKVSLLASSQILSLRTLLGADDTSLVPDLRVSGQI
jgi:hypothetical protein